MPKTCITFAEFGARVMVEDKEVEHYAVQVDPVKKEVSCWIASEVGKVRDLFNTRILTSLTGVFSNKCRHFRSFG